MPSKKGADRAANRPPEIVFKSKMQGVYVTFLNLDGKLTALAKHRALRGKDGQAIADAYNAFVKKLVSVVSMHRASPGKEAVIEEAPSLDEFLSS